MNTRENTVHCHEPQGVFTEMFGDWIDGLAVPDFAWTVNTQAKYSAFLQKVPEIFAWDTSDDHLANLQVLARSVAVRRLRSCLEHIGRYDMDLSSAMRAS